MQQTIGLDIHKKFICACVMQEDKTLGRFYNRIKRRRGHNIAIVATARKMLKYAYTMLINDIPYHALQVHKAT